MGGGNGAKAKQARERNAKLAKNTKSGVKPDVLICQGCFSVKGIITDMPKVLKPHFEATRDDARHKRFDTIEAMYKIPAGSA